MDTHKPVFFDKAAHTTMVSVTINSDLNARAKEAKINISQVIEEAVAAKLTEILQASPEAGVRADLLAYNAFIAEYGLFADHLRRQE